MALIIATFEDVDLATWEKMVVISLAAGSGSVENACAIIIEVAPNHKPPSQGEVGFGSSSVSHGLFCST